MQCRLCIALPSILAACASAGTGDQGTKEDAAVAPPRTAASAPAGALPLPLPKIVECGSQMANPSKCEFKLVVHYDEASGCVVTAPYFAVMPHVLNGEPVTWTLDLAGFSSAKLTLAEVQHGIDALPGTPGSGAVWNQYWTEPTSVYGGIEIRAKVDMDNAPEAYFPHGWRIVKARGVDCKIEDPIIGNGKTKTHLEKIIRELRHLHG